jgi:hypothetical protein
MVQWCYKWLLNREPTDSDILRNVPVTSVINKTKSVLFMSTRFSNLYTAVHTPYRHQPTQPPISP